MAAIRVLLADDDTMVLEALSEVIRADPDLELVAVAEDADQAIELACVHRPDVAIVDIRMPGGGGLRVASELRAMVPGTRVLAHSALSDHATAVQMLELGAVGYLLKGTSPADIRMAVQRAAGGRETLSPEVLSSLVHDLASHLHGQELAAAEAEERAARIGRAIAGEGWRLVYQPIVELGSRAVAGFEALARFTMPPERPPDVWFKEAGEIGLGVELELVAIDTALRALRRIPVDAYLSLNASHRTAVSPELVRTLEGHSMERIVVEITEHEPIDDYEDLGAALELLRGLGTRVAIDDAGAGFASLRHILNIRPDVIKLDVGLTHGVDQDPGRRALAAALISFAEQMDVAIVAEGIETLEELETLQQLGARYGQGYYLGRPAPLAEAGFARPLG
jgi:EAL domain-containing protein (putative c-di-GMP-specific phosphodiesterase class I)/CheY-like chemotaxis protein